MAAKGSLNWLKDRSAGVLLHPTSLHGEQGVGVLGATAYSFINFLADAGIKNWQILPLVPTGFGDSPYSGLSAFAGNPLLIDLVPLVENGLLRSNDLEPLMGLPRDHVDFVSLARIKWPLLGLAYKNFKKHKRAYLPNYSRYSDFKKKHESWLEPFCAYMALKNRFNGAFWGDWPLDCRTFDAAKKSIHWKATADDRDAHAFYQYVFFGQWSQIKAYANTSGVSIIGDAPIFVALDSADVWAHPELFEMSGSGVPTHVAGVPPDYFSETGQMWGNPLYDWKRMKADGYQWWIDRLNCNFELVDIVRLDHFRGFYDYWKIPQGSEDARSGKWAQGPKDDLFKAIKKQIPDAKLIAEDLGEIHDKIPAFRDRLGLPGMAILHFAFGGGAENLYLPHNLVPNSVVYPGTHDNDTTHGWYASASAAEQDRVRRYLRVDGSDIAWDMIRICYQSPSNLAIFAMQDLMALGTEARMNAPGTAQGNWQWRMTPEAFDNQQGCASYLKGLGKLYGR
ncbi:MAG: 4-alpha-glucanotransferase [Puniceicoccaceae bacterium]